ncbi:MAG: hypothetical protein K2Q33_02695, partial [Gammaproteobacteria bacterium]|nr:hypothetical protein [Gammaproteobacteria bacterium]
NKQDTANFAAIKLKRLQECSFPKDSKEWAALAAGAQRAQDLVWIAENQYLESHQNYQGCLEEQNQHTEALKKLKEAYQQNRITYVNLCYDIAQSEARVHSTKPLSAEEQHEFLQTKMLPPNFSR